MSQAIKNCMSLDSYNTCSEVTQDKDYLQTLSKTLTLCWRQLAQVHIRSREEKCHC